MKKEINIKVNVLAFTRLIISKRINFEFEITINGIGDGVIYTDSYMTTHEFGCYIENLMKRRDGIANFIVDHNILSHGELKNLVSKSFDEALKDFGKTFG